MKEYIRPTSEIVKIKFQDNILENTNGTELIIGSVQGQDSGAAKEALDFYEFEEE